MLCQRGLKGRAQDSRRLITPGPEEAPPSQAERFCMKEELWFGQSCHLPVQETQETQVRFLGWEDPLEKGMATHSSVRAWRIPWTEEPGGLQSIESQRVRHD